jgi:hypothetical protein
MITLNATFKPISEIMAYKHDKVLGRYIKDFGEEKERATACFEALKQFMIVCAVSEGIKTSSEPVDDMWHTFLLFTKDYREFCHAYLGRFIDHRPGGGFPSDTYKKTRECAVELFGKLDEDYWPLEKAAAKCDDGSGASSYCP